MGWGGEFCWLLSFLSFSISFIFLIIIVKPIIARLERDAVGRVSKYKKASTFLVQTLGAEDLKRHLMAEKVYDNL